MSDAMSVKEEKRLLKKYERAGGLMYDALCHYADPESYHAVAFLFDRPCGDFASDFGNEHYSDYDRPMPGKRARRALRKVTKQYGDLVFKAKFPGGNWELSKPDSTVETIPQQADNIQ